LEKEDTDEKVNDMRDGEALSRFTRKENRQQGGILNLTDEKQTP